MPQFFIERPVFAWVLAIFIILGGLLALPNLAVERFPTVAPPSVNIYATYPGATSQSMTDSVVAPIERELSGARNLLYFESSTDTSGLAQITATFEPGTAPELAQVDVQNRLKAVESRLPQAVRQLGVQVESASSGFLMIVALRSTDGRYSAEDLGDYMARNLVEEFKRIDGVGRVQSFASERAMRIWVDPQKLASYGVTIGDIVGAIQTQNALIAPGRVGGSPTVEGQTITLPLTAEGQLQTPEEFAAISLRANTDGSRLTIGDVARVELGAQSYDFRSFLSGDAAVAAALQLSPGANMVQTGEAVHARLEELKAAMPEGIEVVVPYDNAPFVEISIEKVIHTLVEAMVLVFLVMFLFLQNIRYTLIPSIVAPIALLGTLAIMLLAGFSINVLTMFGMVLAIGIIVDDAIVVVENVERIMATEGLSPKEATKKAMKEITGAVIGITLVLSAVFIPMAFSSGSVGVIYRQFSMSMAVSILFSALLALTLTPALCATILKPVAGHHERKGFFGWFNRRFDRLTNGYVGWVGALLKRTSRAMIVFVALVIVVGVTFVRLPTAFLPDEDQGFFITMFTLPADATQDRTLRAVQEYEAHLAERPGINGYTSILGFSFAGAGPNTALSFAQMTDWKKRDGATAQDEIDAVNAAMGAYPDGTVMAVNLPAIAELGTSSGFAMRLQDLRNQGEGALQGAMGQLLGMAAQSDKLVGVYPESLPGGSRIRLQIDRQAAEAQGVSFETISSTISAALGSSYVNDFPNQGRLQQVIVQADAPFRMQLDQVLGLYVRNASGGMSPLSNFVTPSWEDASMQQIRYNGYPSARIAGSAAPGVSTGDAMAEMERLAQQLPPGFSVAWTGTSLQEKQTGDEAMMLLILSMLVVFLVLAALYESWTIPLSVMLVVPLGIIGAVAATMIRGLPNDVFFKVGLITIIGLSAKNAILIVEFAKMQRALGKPLIEATIEAARLRLRPIIMTSLAFTLGVTPLVIASGASSATQHAIGTGVFGGMITGTILAILLVPVFFVVVVGGFEKLKTWAADRNLRLPRLPRLRKEV